MKKSAMIGGAAALAIAMAAPAQAAGGGQMAGTVAPVCEVNDLFATIDFPSMNSGATISDNIELKCNDFDGATVTLISAEGGMESDDEEDNEIEYIATLTSSVIQGGSFSLDLPPVQGDNNKSATGTANGGSALAGGVSGTLSISLKETAIYAGGYSDTITVQLTAL